MMQTNSNLDWQKIYSSYSPKLLGICRRYVQDIYTAEDIVQDSFITAIQKNHQLNDEKALFAWLKKIVVNNALQHIRKHSQDTFVTTEPSEIPDTYSEMDHHLLEEKNVFIYDFTSEELLSSIDSLPPHHKSVFNLYFIENFSHAEISSVLDITVNTSKSHLLRAKKSVQNYLLNNIVSQNTPKKKLAQLMVIFGLGGLLWAQTFQSKFADFTISPSKKLKIPADGKTDYVSLPSLNQTLRKKMVIGSTFLLIILASVFLLNTKSSFFTKDITAASTDFSTGKQTALDKNHKIIKADHYFKSLSPQGNSDQENTLHEGAKNLSIENPSVKEKSSEAIKNTRKIMHKDSVNETSQKVIVVKKIIKRDTIFIER